MRFFDISEGPVCCFEFIYPIHAETLHAMEGFYRYSVVPPPAPYKTRAYEVDFLDVLRYNIVPAVSIIGSGVLLSIPSATLLFVIGIASGSSFPEILEFTPAIMNLKVGIVLITFIIAMIFSASSGFHIGSMVYLLMKEKKIQVKKVFYDHILIAAAFVCAGIILQYVLLVM
ncbi:hypothetical protein J7K19_07755 [bacterium]|nr:hypothetical protein [bacterium]